MMLLVLLLLFVVTSEPLRINTMQQERLFHGRLRRIRADSTKSSAANTASLLSGDSSDSTRLHLVAQIPQITRGANRTFLSSSGPCSDEIKTTAPASLLIAIISMFVMIPVALALYFHFSATPDGVQSSKTHELVEGSPVELAKPIGVILVTFGVFVVCMYTYLIICNLLISGTEKISPWYSPNAAIEQWIDAALPMVAETDWFNTAIDTIPYLLSLIVLLQHVYYHDLRAGCVFVSFIGFGFIMWGIVQLLTVVHDDERCNPEIHRTAAWFLYRLDIALTGCNSLVWSSNSAVFATAIATQTVVCK